MRGSIIKESNEPVEPAVRVVFLDQFRPVAAKYLPEKKPFYSLVVGNFAQSNGDDIASLVKSLSDQQCNAIIFAGPHAQNIMSNKLKALANCCPISHLAGNSFQDVLKLFSSELGNHDDEAAIVVVGQGKNLMHVLAEIKASGIKIK